MATGGTIGRRGPDRLDQTDYGFRGSTLNAQELLGAVPEARNVADVCVFDVTHMSSADVAPTALVTLANRVEEIVAEGYHDGIVITHGTATLEETAFLFDLTISRGVPIVLVGAQRPIGSLGGDAERNLLDAVRVAADPRWGVTGAVVVAGGEVHAARDVTKSNTYELATFRSPRWGPLGRVEPDGAITFGRAPRPSRDAPHVPLTAVQILPDVELHVSTLGSRGLGIPAMVDRGVAGIVNAGLAPGLPTPAELAHLLDAVAMGVMVIQASRAYSGPVPPLTRTRERGFLPSRDLSALKSRILSMVSLASGDGPGTFERYFAD